MNIYVDSKYKKCVLILTDMKTCFFPGDPFSKSDRNCFLSCIYDVKTGGEKKFCQELLLIFMCEPSYTFFFPGDFCMCDTKVWPVEKTLLIFFFLYLSALTG